MTDYTLSMRTAVKATRYSAGDHYAGCCKGMSGRLISIKLTVAALEWKTELKALAGLAAGD